jgi:hypothetical protein
MGLSARIVALLAVLLVAVPAGAQTSAPTLEVIQRFQLPDGNEIEFDGGRVYVNGYANSPNTGVHVFEIGKGKLRHTGDLLCQGINDVAAMDRGFIAIGFQQGGTGCNEPSSLPVTGFSGGMQIADMRDPARGLLLGTIELPGGVHTLTRLPGTDLVFTALGGADAYAAFQGLTHILDVSDPDKPEIAATYRSELNAAGCHDILFQEIDRKMIGFCPGLGGTEIWDMSDPLKPVAIGRMPLPAAQLPHRVAVSADGKMAAISDEAYAGHACAGGGPIGAMWFYDISDLANPKFLNFYGPQRGMLPVGAVSGQSLSCTAHNFNFIGNTYSVVIAWIAGGTQVLDVSDPAAIKEVAFYRPDDAVAMSSYWYRGKIYVADRNRGLEVLKLTP